MHRNYGPGISLLIPDSNYNYCGIKPITDPGAAVRGVKCSAAAAMSPRTAPSVIAHVSVRLFKYEGFFLLKYRVGSGS